jgi:hypothetical protein
VFVQPKKPPSRCRPLLSAHISCPLSRRSSLLSPHKQGYIPLNEDTTRKTQPPFSSWKHHSTSPQTALRSNTAPCPYSAPKYQIDQTARRTEGMSQKLPRFCSISRCVELAEGILAAQAWKGQKASRPEREAEGYLPDKIIDETQVVRYYLKGSSEIIQC